jgi:hypothetical protein
MEGKAEGMDKAEAMVKAGLGHAGFNKTATANPGQAFGQEEGKAQIEAIMAREAGMIGKA